MKILHISRHFYPMLGGTERHILDASVALIERGHRCRVLAIDRDTVAGSFSQLPATDSYQGIEIVRVPAWGSHKKPILAAPLPALRCLEWADIVHLHDLRFLVETTLALKAFFRYKVVLSSHGLLFHTPWRRRLKELLWRQYYSRLLRRCDRLLAVSLQDLEAFEGFPEGLAQLLENGIDYESFAAIKGSPQPGQLLYFGRLAENKGLEGLFRVLGRLRHREWRCRLIGAGVVEYVEQLEGLARDLGIAQKLEWAGAVEQEALYRALASAHICVFPSTFEGFGLTVVEAMAAGKLCVANDIPTYRHVLGPRDAGVLVDFSAVDAAALSLDGLLSQAPEAHEAMLARAREVAAAYSWTHKGQELEAIYRQLGA